MNIRSEIQKEFLATIGKVVNGEMTKVEFQRHMLTFAMEEFSVALPTAAVFYEFAKQVYLRENPVHKQFLQSEFVLDTCYH